MNDEAEAERMATLLDSETLIADISNWIREYAENAGISTLVIGVSGGIDSAVTSTLCAMTGMHTILLNMPIHQDQKQYQLSNQHIQWLKSKWDNLESRKVDLTATFDSLMNDIGDGEMTDLAAANSRARLRMTTLYAIATSNEGIVVGTGNKVEDFGVGFFTKYGDGGVDISPIADLYKTEVYALARALGIIEEIRNAAPTDGLWNDGRTDEEQMQANYNELEWAMKEFAEPSDSELTQRQSEVLEIFRRLNTQNAHKMKDIPVYKRQQQG